MTDVCVYLLTIVAAAVFCSVIKRIAGNKGTTGKVFELLLGVFLFITAVSPWAKLKFADLSLYIDELEVDASGYVMDGVEAAALASSDIIKSQTESYILNKAALLGMEVEVNVTLSDTEPGVPEAVSITGTASPYLKRQLQAFISQNIGIPEDMQTWK